MQFKTILVSMNSAEAAERLLGPAVDIARRNGAHLIGLHAADDIAAYSDFAMMGGAPSISTMREAQAERAESIAALFSKAVAGEDFVSEWRFSQHHSSSASDAILEQARTADLVVMAQERPDAAKGPAGVILERTIRKAGRPVLVIPHAGSFGGVPKKALVGWSATREAARAAHDALPLLAKGAAVAILTARIGGAHNPAIASAKELALVFDRHGMSAEVVESLAKDVTVGDILLNEAFERGAELIVTGAFGHSRIYDFVIGATTTRLLESMTAPVLFSS